MSAIDDRKCSSCMHIIVCAFQQKLSKLVSVEGSHYFYKNCMNNGRAFCDNIATVCIHYDQEEFV